MYIRFARIGGTNEHKCVELKYMTLENVSEVTFFGVDNVIEV